MREDSQVLCLQVETDLEVVRRWWGRSSQAGFYDHLRNKKLVQVREAGPTPDEGLKVRWRSGAGGLGREGGSG